MDDSTLYEPLVKCLNYRNFQGFKVLIVKYQDLPKLVENCLKRPLNGFESLKKRQEFLLQILNYAYNREFYTYEELYGTGKNEWTDGLIDRGW